MPLCLVPLYHRPRAQDLFRYFKSITGSAHGFQAFSVLSTLSLLPVNKMQKLFHYLFLYVQKSV